MTKLKVKSLFNIEVVKQSGYVFTPYLPMIDTPLLNDIQSLGRTMRTSRYATTPIYNISNDNKTTECIIDKYLQILKNEKFI